MNRQELAKFIEQSLLKDINLTEEEYKQVYQCMQELIYNLNVPSRWGSQTPFTNFTSITLCTICIPLPLNTTICPSSISSP